MADNVPTDVFVDTFTAHTLMDGDKKVEQHFDRGMPFFNNVLLSYPLQTHWDGERDPS